MKYRALFLTTFLISCPAFAQSADKAVDNASDKTSETDRPVYSPVLPVHIQPRQAGADSMSKAAADVAQENKINPDALGIYTRPSEGGLGEDVWKDYTSAALVSDLAALNLNFKSPVMWSLLKRAVLTTPSAQAFPDDKKSDVFSERLRTFIDIGAFDETVTLYNKLEGNVPSPKAALAGAQGITALGQTGVACLEEKALTTDLKESQSTSFWTDLNSFCKTLLATDTPSTADDTASLTKASTFFIAGKKLSAPAALSELNGKSVIEIFAMGKAGLLPDSIFTPDKIKTLKPEIISLLLKILPSPPARLCLMAAAAEKGIIDREAFQTEFITQSSQTMASYWQPYFVLYAKVRSASADADKSTALKQVLKMSDSSANAALIPFAKSYADLKTIDSFSQDEARKVVSLLIRSKLNVSGNWTAKALGKSDISLKESVTDLEVLGYLADQNSGITTDKETKSDKHGKSRETVDNPEINAIILMLQNEEAEDKVKDKSYEKLLSLTAPNDYVMPSKEFMNSLHQASLNQDTGKIILYSLQILNGQRISQIHPAALFRISEGLKSVGLSEENTSLAHEALADLIEYKN